MVTAKAMCTGHPQLQQEQPLLGGMDGGRDREREGKHRRKGKGAEKNRSGFLGVRKVLENKGA